MGSRERAERILEEIINRVGTTRWKIKLEPYITPSTNINFT